jgi:hypothetical protein
MDTARRTRREAYSVSWGWRRVCGMERRAQLSFLSPPQSESPATTPVTTPTPATTPVEAPREDPHPLPSPPPSAPPVSTPVTTPTPVYTIGYTPSEPLYTPFYKRARMSPKQWWETAEATPRSGRTRSSCTVDEPSAPPTTTSGLSPTPPVTAKMSSSSWWDTAEVVTRAGRTRSGSGTKRKK